MPWACARVAGRSDEGRHVLREARLEAGHRVCADAHELVHARQAAQEHPVAEVHVPGQLHGVGQDQVAAELAVVRDVHVGHDPVVVAQARDAGVLHGAGVDGHELADRVAVADLQAGGFAGVLLVLRRPADRRELKDAVALADGRVALDHAVRTDRAARADAHVRADHRIGADAHRLVAARPWDRRSRWRGSASWQRCDGDQSTLRNVHIRSASTTVSPSTLARVLNL